MSRPLPFTNRDTALAILSHPSQKNIFPISYPNGQTQEEEIVVTPSYQQAVQDYLADEAEIVIEPESARQQQQGKEDGDYAGGLGELANVLAKYEIPAGMLSKLLGLRNFDRAEIIVDDSGSMREYTDALGPNGRAQSRWQEAKNRILEMMELMSYVRKAPPVHVSFLNRRQVLVFERRRFDPASGEPEESPVCFYQRVRQELESTFQLNLPNGSTPALERIRESLRNSSGKLTLFYFLGDGVPNGGQVACEEISRLLTNRPEPESNPFTFLSCTNEDKQTEWMKECEEVAPYCAELDDYEDECREVLTDQGIAFPYSYGLHLVGQLVAAFNPHDLDALDESVPLTKPTLEDLLGYRPSDAEYRYYFDNFLAAQRKLKLTPIQKKFVAKLPDLYRVFCTTQRAADIPDVAQYKTKFKSVAQNKMQQKTVLPPPEPSSECCVIL